MKLKEIYKSDRYYTICECGRVSGLVIDVTCGGIAMYSRIVELTADEIEEFKQNGNLDDLAYKIGKRDAEILKRQLLPESENEKIEYTDTL